MALSAAQEIHLRCMCIVWAVGSWRCCNLDWCNAGVRFPGLIHPGLIGTAPSHELLKIWNDRERKLVEDGDKAVTLGGVLHTRPLGMYCCLRIVQ